MMISHDLLETVLKKAREGKIDWEQLSKDGYIARLGPSSIVIDRAGSEFIMRFVNDKGTTLDQIRSIDEPQLGRSLREIYELARRKALQVDEALLTMKRDLERL